MIKINEIETDKYIIVSDDRIKELVTEIYNMIAHKSNLTLDKYKQMLSEINEIFNVYKEVENSQVILKDISELKEILNLYAKDRGVV